MKRTLLLAALFILLGAGAFYAIYNKKHQNETHVSWDMDFSVPQTGKIYKVFLADRTGMSATLTRADGYWMYNNKYKARPAAIESLLETIAKQTVWYIPPQAAVDNMVKSLATEGIKVELFDKEGKKIKGFYVGGTTIDERGTFMIMEGSEQPYVMHIPSFIGQLRVRYLLKEEDWRDRMIFAENSDNITSLSVEYPQQKSESFRLEKERNEYKVRPFYNTTPASTTPQRKGFPEAYLTVFEKLAAESFENSYEARDSVAELVPFAIVSLKREDGSEKNVRFWPMSIEERMDNGANYVHRYFAETNDKDFYIVQDRVFGPAFRGYKYFFEGSGR